MFFEQKFYIFLDFDRKIHWLYIYILGIIIIADGNEYINTINNN